MKLKYLFFLLSVFLFSSEASYKWSYKDESHIRMILKLPVKNTNHALSIYGVKSFMILKKFVFSSKEAMPIRWKSLISLAHVYPYKSRTIIKKSLNSSQWFLRNAGLLALEIIDPKASIKKASYLLDDSSLIVRTAAVDLIKKHKAYRYKIYLKYKLNATDSFNKNHSLWIRHHIVSTLADLYEPGEEQLFISFLHDNDKRLYKSSIIALERLTNQTFRVNNKNHDNNINIQKQKWINWWSKQSKSSRSSKNKKSILL